MPIVPVATVGGHDTVFVLSEGRILARRSGGWRARGATLPITLGVPLEVSPEILPTLNRLAARRRFPVFG